MRLENNHHLKALELPKILALLAEQADCDDAAQMARELQPVGTLEEASALLEETWDAYRMIAQFGAPSFRGLHNVTNAVRRAEAGGLLNLTELLRIGETLRTLRGIYDWRQKSAGLKTALEWRFSNLMPNKYMEDRIFNVVISEEEVSDNASPELASIRRKMRAAGARVREKLDHMIHSITYQKYLQEPIITQREGRYVVPVKAECRGNVPGLVHDTSGSGATVFVEPMAVVEANNEIRVLESKERAEIERILGELSAEVGSFASTIVTGYNSAVEINMIFAKANLGYQMKATKPVLNDRGVINLKKARHPLIAANKVVPTDIRLGEDFDTLVITGPNTGGKTVSLKTVGLFCLMAMCGLLIPAAEQSEVSVFNRVLADIGDEQSIEQSLSTFSAHMVNQIAILKQADEHSLVLLDELGAGTDPVEGAALAMAILEQLRTTGAKIAATTHYAELKAYALQTPGVENACCEFNVQTLCPTYRLLIGVPGRSNAFAISLRLGLSEAIVDRAKTFVSNENLRFENVVKQLEENRQQLETQKKAAEEAKLQAQELKKEAAGEREKIQKKMQQEMDEAREKAALLVSRTRGQADALLEELEALKKQKDRVISAEEKARIKAGLRGLEEQADPVSRKKDDHYVLPRPLKPGDPVLIFDLDKEAAVLEVEKGGKTVLVQAGIIKTQVPIENLRLLTNRQQKKRGTVGTRRAVTRTAVETQAKAELDLRGENADEAIFHVDQFLDHAQLGGLSQVTLIHGKGTGVLRKAVQEHLKHHPSVKSFRLGTYGEGESGVTIAELK